jgi:hypothetical protein
MATKREIDHLMGAIPGQVKAAHGARRSANDKSGPPDVEGEFAGNPIDPADYGFDMFGCEGETYIRERSREIARKNAAVHAQPGSGESHATKGDFGEAKKREYSENESISLDAADNDKESGRTQEGN